ncbi:Basic helix-loop-helix transcription factor scleraxis [Fasciolopsis buskii]|uniref:Basic helix-loop-helix transcription factor scleraxis n=1 Tax=Fasciolopsis buskii TaxID=27845 RepID=A0A8E0RSL5_9TREM|nr:Basic helix-loop-helix transcription factor scleraxis [Fasciolopsis buski]
MSSATQHSMLNIHVGSAQCRKRLWPEPDDSLNATRNLRQSESNTSASYSLPSSNKNNGSESAMDFVPVKRIANERERSRTASVNDAFLMLRRLIPTEPMNRKLSKIETLRLASSYISHLHAVLVTGSNPADQPCLRHQQLAPAMCQLDRCPTSAITTQSATRTPLGSERPHRPVCTFCVTEMKQHQRSMVERTKESKSINSKVT